MRTLLTLAFVLLAQAVPAQEKPASETKSKPGEASKVEDRGAAARPRPAIRVLQNPYDLASYYRSGGSSPDGWAGLAHDPAYSIAAAYRGESSPYGWSRFWTNGYGAQRPAPMVPYRRTIGQNGDLFLMVPFLAPVGPISGAFAGY
jgi:hypothetical protein